MVIDRKLGHNARAHVMDSSDDSDDDDKNGLITSGMDRKKRRGIIEKRRRDRINGSLSELKRLVPSACEKQGSSKLEKAEILQLTVEYLKELQQKGVNHCCVGSSCPSTFEYRNMGFRECMTESLRYLSMEEGLEHHHPLQNRLMRHLQMVLGNMENALKQHQQYMQAIGVVPPPTNLLPNQNAQLMMNPHALIGGAVSPPSAALAAAWGNCGGMMNSSGYGSGFMNGPSTSSSPPGVYGPISGMSSGNTAAGNVQYHHSMLPQVQGQMASSTPVGLSLGGTGYVGTRSSSPTRDPTGNGRGAESSKDLRPQHFSPVNQAPTQHHQHHHHHQVNQPPPSTSGGSYRLANSKQEKGNDLIPLHNLNSGSGGSSGGGGGVGAGGLIPFSEGMSTSPGSSAAVANNFLYQPFPPSVMGADHGYSIGYSTLTNNNNSSGATVSRFWTGSELAYA